MMDLIGLPLTSMILFILAGLLIGHALWYRDRSADFEKIDWLERRYRQARKVARLRRQEQHHLRKMRDDQLYEAGTSRQRYEANLLELKSLERARDSVTEELERLRAQHHEVSEQVGREQRRNDMLVDQLQEVLKTNASLEQQQHQQSERFRQLVAAVKREAPELTPRIELLIKADQSAHAGSTPPDRPPQEAAPMDDDPNQAIQLDKVREQLEELLPLRAESAESSLTIAEQRMELAAQQEEIERLSRQTTDAAANRRAA